MLRSAAALNRIARERKCDVIHALGRSAAWSAYLAARLRGIPFVTSWYKGFRDQNIFKHLYNGVMARGDRVVAVSEQIAQLISDRYGTPWERIAVVPSSIDFERFDPAEVARERVEAMRHAWGIKRDTKVILIVGRIVRRKGHHVVVKAAKRLKEMGLQGFLVRLRRRGPRPHPLHRRALGSGAGHRHHGCHPHGGAGRRHAGRLCRGRGRGVGGGAAGRPATLDPGGAGDGAAGDRLRPRRRAGRRAHPAGGAGEPHHRLALSTPATTRRWRRPCCGCFPCPSRPAAPWARAAATGCSAISMRRRSPSRRCGFMTRSPAAK